MLITDLAIDELEEFEGDVVELLVDRSDDGFDGAFDSLDARFKWTGVFFGVLVEARETYHEVDRRHLDEIQVLELSLIFMNLQF